MYQSPIEIAVNSIIKEQNERLENEIVYRASMETGINLNRDELLKALQHDRDQYDKGYSDGIKDFAERLESKLQNNMDISAVGYESIIQNINDIVKEMIGESYEKDTHSL